MMVTITVHLYNTVWRVRMKA